MPNPRPHLRVFLSHSSGDKATVRELYQRLIEDGFAPWLDEEDLLPGHEWHQEIRKAVRNSDIALVCFSKSSINSKGYLQKEIEFILDTAEEQPEGSIFLIPVRLDQCQVPERLARWHWVNFFEEGGYARLAKALRVREAAIRKPVLFPQKPEDTVLTRSLETYHSTSAVASWIFGSALLVFLFIAIFMLPNPTFFQKATIRFLMALAAALFALFFLGGVLLKGTFKGLFLSATGGFALFILIQFVVDPFKVDPFKAGPTNTNAATPIGSPTASPSLLASSATEQRKISSPSEVREMNTLATPTVEKVDHSGDSPRTRPSSSAANKSPEEPKFNFTKPRDPWFDFDAAFSGGEESDDTKLYNQFYSQWKAARWKAAYETAKEFIQKFPRSLGTEDVKKYIAEYEKQVSK